MFVLLGLALALALVAVGYKVYSPRAEEEGGCVSSHQLGCASGVILVDRWFNVQPFLLQRIPERWMNVFPSLPLVPTTNPLPQVPIFILHPLPQHLRCLIPPVLPSDHLWGDIMFIRSVSVGAV